MHRKILGQYSFTETIKTMAGYHAEVFHVTDGSKESVVKIISKPEFSQREIMVRLSEDLEMYNNELRRIGVKTPEMAIDFVECEGSDHLVVISPYCGKDISSLINKGSTEECLAAVEQIIDQLRKFFEHPVSEGSFELQVGIDPKPENFTMDGNGGFHYIDNMPPRHRMNGHPLVEFPQPESQKGFALAYFRHFDMRGILIVLLTQLCRLRIAERPQFRQIISQFAQDVGNHRLVSYLDGLPSTSFVVANTDERQEIINDIESDDMYAMRDIATQLAYEQPALYGRQVIEQIFHLSHFYTDQPSTADTELVKKMLSAMIQQQPIESVYDR